MTTLGRGIVAHTRYNTIMLGVSGDLSHSYDVVPKYQVQNVGLGFATKNKAIEFARKTGKFGWHRQYEIYRAHTDITKVEWEEMKKYRGGMFGYLPEQMAKRYAASAYGDYAEKIRKKYGIKEDR